MGTYYSSIDRSGDSLQSKVISFLRFPLIVAVVLIHTEPHSVITGSNEVVGTQHYGIYNMIFMLISNIFANVAVPLFFFISGFLFFNKGGYFTLPTYLKKIRKRAKSLLVPYIIWNIIVYLILLLWQTFWPGSSSGSKLVINYSFVEWLRIFWDIRSGFYPLCAQFWFLRDLMVVMILSPVVYLLVKLLKQYFLCILGILWFTNTWFDITGLSIAAIFFFSCGSYFGIMKKNFVKTLRPLMKLSVIIYPIVCLTILYFSSDPAVVKYLLSLSTLIGMILAITISAYYISREKWSVNNFLSESSFFIYAYHQIILALVVKIAVKTFYPMSDFGLLAVYIISPILIICFGLGLYYVLRHYLPRFTSIITGGR